MEGRHTIAHIVCIDIETKSGSPRPLTTMKTIKAALSKEATKKWKTPARREQHINDPVEQNRVEAAMLKDWASEGLDFLKGEIYCLCAALVPNDMADIEVVTFSQRKHGDEETMLKAFVKWMHVNNQHGPPAIAGWNSDAFDCPMLVWRLVKYDLHNEALKYVPTKWGDSSYDLMSFAKLGARGKQHKLDAMAQFFGIPGKPCLDDEVCDKAGLPRGTKMDGSLVWLLLDKGFEEVVEEYCESDVRAVVLMLPTLELVSRRSRK